MSRIPDTDWRINLQVVHPAGLQEPQVMREARVLRRLREFIMANGEDLTDPTRSKLEKNINTRLLNIMDEVRDATPQR